MLPAHQNVIARLRKAFGASRSEPQDLALTFRNYTPMQIARIMADSLSITELGATIGHLEHEWNQKLYQLFPAYKLRPESPFSFTSFLLRQLPSDIPLSLLDLGSGDCFLAQLLSTRLHPNCEFTCIDSAKLDSNTLPHNVHFQQAEIKNWISENRKHRFDFTIIGGTLSLFSHKERRAILSWVKRHAGAILIREVPRVRNLVEAHAEQAAFLDRSYALLSEAELKDLLRETGFRLVALEHEFDIYAHAASI